MDHKPAAAQLEFTGPTVDVPLCRLQGLLEVRRALDALAMEAKTGAGPVHPEDLQLLADKLNQEVSQVVGLWVTDMLERNRGENMAHPALQATFAGALSIPVGLDEPDAENRLYRRWLADAGTAAGLDSALLTAFDQRFDSRHQGGSGG